MATPKNDPAKKEEPAKKATAKPRAPRKKPVAYVKEEVVPVLKADVRRFLGFPLWVHYVTGGVILLVFLSLFLFQCNKRKVSRNGEKVEDLKTQITRMDSSLRRMERERDLDDIRDIEDQKEADQSTQDRRNAQKENREVQSDSKKKE